MSCLEEGGGMEEGVVKELRGVARGCVAVFRVSD